MLLQCFAKHWNENPLQILNRQARSFEDSAKRSLGNFFGMHWHNYEYPLFVCINGMTAFLSQEYKSVFCDERDYALWRGCLRHIELWMYVS